MRFNRNILSREGGAILNILSRAPELQGFTLIGGTALALQIGHRVSLDFDFARFGGLLPGTSIDQLMARLKREGHHVQMITSPADIAAFKINNAMNLLDYARDYVIDSIKLTFFVHGKTEQQQAFYRSTPKQREPEMSFDLLGIEGLKVAKTLVLADRVRSRDLYDLYVLMRDHGYSMDRLVAVVRELGTVDDPEYYKTIMRGEIPLDSEDEGLEAVDLEAGSEQMFGYFNTAIDEYETRLARDAYLDESK
jgi:hypothetical protein